MSNFVRRWVVFSGQKRCYLHRYWIMGMMKKECARNIIGLTSLCKSQYFLCRKIDEGKEESSHS